MVEKIRPGQAEVEVKVEVENKLHGSAPLQEDVARVRKTTNSIK